MRAGAEPGSELQLKVTRRAKDGFILGHLNCTGLKMPVTDIKEVMPSSFRSKSDTPKSIKISSLLIPCWVEACRCSVTKM